MKRVLLGLTALSLAGCNYGMQHQGYQYGGGHNYHSSYGYHAPMPQHQYRQNRTSLEFSAGAEEFTGGNILSYNAGIGGAIQKVEYNDAYDTAWRANGGIAHNVAPRTTLLARGFYKKADASGDPVTIFQGNIGNTVTGSFSDQKSYGAEIGFREYLNDHHARAKLRPYMGGTVGAAYQESISIENLNGAGNSVELYDGEWVPTASALLGVEMPVSRSFSLGLESGLRYEGKRESDLATLESTNAYSVPLTLRGRFQF